MDEAWKGKPMPVTERAARRSREPRARSRLLFHEIGRPAVPPQLIQKRQTRLEGFEDKILALYARGMTTRDIQAQVQDLYGVEISPTFISNITEAVMDEVRQWQTRPLDAVYPIVYVD
jgi:transposase-like protein